MLDMLLVVKNKVPFVSICEDTMSYSLTIGSAMMSPSKYPEE